VVADIKNCRIVVFDPPPARHIQRQFGVTKDCRAAPGHFLYPNGDTPLPGGRLLLTEIGTRSAAEMDLETGRILHRIPLHVDYPSDTQPTRAGQYLVVDYSRPGKVVIVDRSGKIVWSYGPTSGPGRLDHPSLALELPNGNLILNARRRSSGSTASRGSRGGPPGTCTHPTEWTSSRRPSAGNLCGRRRSGGAALRGRLPGDAGRGAQAVQVEVEPLPEPPKLRHPAGLRGRAGS